MSGIKHELPLALSSTASSHVYSMEKTSRCGRSWVVPADDIDTTRERTRQKNSTKLDHVAWIRGACKVGLLLVGILQGSKRAGTYLVALAASCLPRYTSRTKDKMQELVVSSCSCLGGPPSWLLLLSFDSFHRGRHPRRELITTGGRMWIYGLCFAIP